MQMIIDEGDKSVMLGRLTEQLAARDQRIAELEASNKRLKAACDGWQQNYDGAKAHNTRLREAIAEMVNKRGELKAKIDDVLGDWSLSLVRQGQKALAPQPEKEGE